MKGEWTPKERIAVRYVFAHRKVMSGSTLSTQDWVIEWICKHYTIAYMLKAIKRWRRQ